MMENGKMPTQLRRRSILFLLLLLVGAGEASAQVFVKVVPVPRHHVIEGMPSRLDPADTTEVAKKLTDLLEDVVPGSTASLYYGQTAGNTHGMLTNVNKANWLTTSMGWLFGTPAVPGGVAKPGALQRATAPIENAMTWLDDVVAPEITMRPEQMANFQRDLKAYQLMRELEVMAKSWHGSLFKFDVLDLVPVYQSVSLDDFGIPSEGVRVGIRYKDTDGKNNLLSAMGVDDPFIGKFDSPRLRYKGPRKWSDVGFSIEATPYDGTETDSSALRIGKQGNELMDRIFFEGMMGRNMANRGVFYTTKVDVDRPSPRLLQARAESARDIRMKQIIDEVDAYQAAYPNLSASEVMDHFKDELAWWRIQPQAIYDNQMQRLDRLRDELQVVNNDVVKNDTDKLKEDSDPQQTQFLKGLYNLYSTLGDSFTNVYNAATGNEDDGDNPEPRLLYKANVSYAKATHEAYLEALAIRRFLYAKLQADAQRGAAQGFVNLWDNVRERQAVLARYETQMDTYKKRGNKVMQDLEKMGLTPDDVIQEANHQ